MALNKYTQADFDSFPVVNGIRQCPSGDYSGIKSFGEWCSFGEECSFGERCSFGEECSFGERCSFGGRCSFGEWCSFGEECSFGGRCSFGEWCSFGKGCSVFGKAFTSLTQAQLPGLYTVKKWTLADGGALYEAGCFHGTYEEAIARAGDRAAYRKAIEFLASL